MNSTNSDVTSYPLSYPMNQPRTDASKRRHAYLRLVKQYHPDAGGDAVMFDQVQKAYDLAIGKRGA
jgi:hypothetical protein